MSSEFEYARKEMMRKKRKARRQPTNRRADPKKYEESALDSFLPTPAELHCSDCGVVLKDGIIRYLDKKGRKIPYCRSCYLTRAGKNVHTRD